MSIIQHAISSGFKNFTRNIWLSLTAITILVISLMAVGLLSLVSTSFEYAIAKLDKQLDIAVFFKEDTALENVQNLENELKAKTDTKQFDILSTKISNKDAEKEALIKNSPRITAAFTFIDNPLSYKLEIKPKSINDFENTAKFLDQDKYKDIILKVENPSTVINKLKQLNNITKNVSFVVIAVFALVSILVMVNILRIAIYNRREEIEIMRLVGATNTYIQSPFIFEGVLYNLVAAFIVLAVFIPLTNATSPYINNYLSSAFNTDPVETAQFSTQVFINLGLNIVAGVLIGIFTIYLAIQRYLKK